MQNDLISRSALMKVFRDAIPSLEKHVEMEQLACLNSCIEDLQNAPAVDAVEVVRCKDCVHWYDEENVCLKIYSDGAAHQNCWQKRDPYDFCSYGKRKQGDTNG